MSIPVDMRINHYIYIKWILKKYPEAAKFIWEKIGRIDESESNKYVLKIQHVIKDPKLILKKLGLVQYTSKILTGMNPVDLWWGENEQLRQHFDNCYKEGFTLTEVSDRLKIAMKTLYEDGNTIVKMLVVTAISAVNYYFKGDNSNV